MAKPSANEQWWNNRGPFVRLSADHTHPTEAEWDALDDYPGRKLVYFIESTHSGLIKIGISVNPYQRLVDLGASWMRMLALEAGGFDREYVLHQMFDHLCLAGVDGAERFPEWWVHGSEWFIPAKELRDYLGPEPS